MIQTMDITAVLQENDTLKKQVAYYQETHEQISQETIYLRGKVEELLEETEQMNRECAYLRGKVEKLDIDHTWRSNLDRVPSTVLSTSEKATANDLRRYFLSHPQLKNADGYYHLEPWRLAENGAQSIGIVRDNINAISTVHENGKPDRPARLPLCDKRIVQIPDASKPHGYHEETYIKPFDIFDHPEIYHEVCTEERQHGGAGRGQGRKRKCEQCGRDMVEKVQVITKQRSDVCPHCQIIHVYPIEQVNTPMLPTDDFPPDDGAGNQVDFVEEEAGNQVDFQEQTEDINGGNQVDFVGCNQVDAVIPTIVQHQVDCSETAAEIPGNQVDFQPLKGDPVTPPYSIGEYPTNGFSWVDHLSRRIGHGPMIYSTGILDQSKKYLHKPAGYKPDIAAYLRGDLAHIYGSRPALPDGTTWLLGFDNEQPELDAQRLIWQQQLATAGIPSVCWLRRPGRWHLEVYVDKAVDRKAFYAHLLSVCPGLAAIPECFPIGNDQNTDGVDRADFGYSWPLWYRVGNQVVECAAEVMFAGDTTPMLSPGIQSDKNGLTWRISQSIMPADLIPALPVPEEVTQGLPKQGGVLLDTRLPERQSSSFDDGLGRAMIADFNAAYTWEQIADVKDGRFRASWRNERTPSVVINADGTAHDFGKTGRYPSHLDKFEAYCLINGLEKREELKRRIAAYQEREQIAS